MSYLEKLQEISTFIFDVDGVLTDGNVLVREDGKLLRQMNTRDGFAIKYALQKGYNVIIITGGRSEGVTKRLKNLGVKEVHAGIQDKVERLEELIDLEIVDLNRTAYMGDDLPDYGCMRLVHLPTCPADAAPEIKALAQYISPINGGRGAARDLIEQVLRVQGQWDFSYPDTDDTELVPHS